MNMLHNLPQLVTAIGGLGTAAFGMVDATKVFNGGVNHIGFRVIRNQISALVPANTVNALPLSGVLQTLQQNWFNGTDLASQKAIAKSLIKLNFNPSTAATMAAVTSVDHSILQAVATSISQGIPLQPSQTDVYARFDLILTALLDATYQQADQQYRNGTRAWAVVASLLLAIAGVSVVDNSAPWNLAFSALAQAVLIGLLATPLAPIAKDLSTALATAVNTLQLVKK